MTRRVTPDELIAGNGIARLAGVRPTAVSNWIRRHNDFPDPWGEVDGRRLWVLEEVQAWLAQRRAAEIARLLKRAQDLEEQAARAAADVLSLEKGGP